MGAKRWVLASVCGAWLAALFACGDSRPTGSGGGVVQLAESGAPDAAPSGRCDASFTAVPEPFPSMSGPTSAYTARTYITSDVSNSFVGSADFRVTFADYTVVTTEGPCSILDAVDPSAGSQLYLPGGEITFQVAAGTAKLPDKGGLNVGMAIATDVAPCAPAQVTTTGDNAGAPAFSLAATVPRRAVVTAPAAAPDAGPTAAVVVPRSQPFAIAWEGATDALVVVELSGVNEQQKVRQIRCVVDGAAAGVSIPPSLLMQLGTVAAGAPSATLRIQTEDYVHSTVSDWGTTFGVYVHATTRSNAPPPSVIVLQ